MNLTVPIQLILLSGTSIASTAIGNLTLGDMEVNFVVMLTGLSSVCYAIHTEKIQECRVSPTHQFKLLDLQWEEVCDFLVRNSQSLAGHPGDMQMFLDLEITNPSTSVSMYLPSIEMDVYYQNTWIGYATITDFFLFPGSNIYHRVPGHYIQTQQNSPAGVAFLSSYIQGSVLTLHIVFKIVTIV